MKLNSKGIAIRYVIAAISIKLAEFVLCALLATILIVVAPNGFYTGGEGVDSALRGGVIFSSSFFLLTLYPFVSTIVFFIAALKCSSGRSIAFVCSIFMLAYSALFALSALGKFPPSFWVAWFFMGLSTFFITKAVLRGINTNA